MCGRFVQKRKPEYLALHYRLSRIAEIAQSWEPRYNLSPALKKEEQELEQLQEQKAAQEEIAAMKSRIAWLKKTLGQPGEGEPVMSRIDTPDFHLKPNRTSYALVIGVEHYAPGIPPAEFADHDAKAVYSYLLALGVPPTHIRRLTDETTTPCPTPNGPKAASGARFTDSAA